MKIMYGSSVAESQQLGGGFARRAARPQNADKRFAGERHAGQADRQPGEQHARELPSAARRGAPTRR